MFSPLVCCLLVCRPYDDSEHEAPTPKGKAKAKPKAKGKGRGKGNGRGGRKGKVKSEDTAPMNTLCTSITNLI